MDTNGENGGDAPLKSKSKEKIDSGSESGAYTDSDSDSEDKKRENGKKKRSKLENSNGNGRKNSSAAADEQQRQQKRQLHKTTSLFMRNLAPSVTKQDLENLVRGYEGFKRVALSDPAPERGFYRRGWATFESHVDVKKICWALQNVKVKDCNPGAIVNRELANRIRPVVNLVTHHKAVVKNDLKIAMKMVQNLDKKWNLWQEAMAAEETNNEATASATTAVAVSNGAANTSVTSENNDKSVNNETDNGNNKDNGATEAANTAEGKTSSGNDTATPTKTAAQIDSDYAKLEETAFCKLTPQGAAFLKHNYTGTNPLLVNITDYLVDEIDAEEEEFLGSESAAGSSSAAKATSAGGGAKSTFDIEIDANYLKILDKLILYLRVVHSIDYYNSIEYHQEDCMPNRCGIMFVRPALPLNAASASLKVSQDEVNTYVQQFENKMKSYVEFKERVEADMAKRLGIKDQKEEIEKFIKLNTQELAADRWLCPLSGKRFKGPEFIRKHLFYKHMEKIMDVKKECEYFNNYVYDPKRPQLPEHPANTKSQQGGASAQSSSSSSSAMSGAAMSSNHHQGYNYQASGYPSYNNNTALLPQPIGGPMSFGSMPNRSINTQWQSGFMPDVMPTSYGGAFTPSFGGVPSGGYQSGYQGYKKPNYGSYQQNRRGGG
jgi:RNA recognition motif-containing protein